MIGAERAALLQTIRDRVRGSFPHALPQRRLLPPAEQSFIYARRSPSGSEQLWLARAITASLAPGVKGGPRARDVRMLAEVDGPAGAGAAEQFVWAVLAPGGRAALAYSEQFGSFDPFIDCNVRVAPLEAGGPSLFVNEHSVTVSRSNCQSALFEGFLDTIRAYMASEGASQAEIDAHAAALDWRPEPDSVSWAPSVSVLPGGRLSITFQLDVVETHSYGWLGEERFTGQWRGLDGSGPMPFEGWTAHSAAATGPASGPPLLFVPGALPLEPQPLADGAEHGVRLGGRAFGFSGRGGPLPLPLPRRALLAHGLLRPPPNI